MRHFCDLPPAKRSDDDDMHDMDDMDEIQDGADDEDDDDDGRDDDAFFCTGVTPMHPDASQLEV